MDAMGFSCRHLVAVLINYKEGEAERVVVCSAYFPYDSKDPQPSTGLGELMHYCEEENLSLVIRCDCNSHHVVWGSTKCNDRGVAWLEFLNFSNLEILSQGNDPTCHSASGD